MDTRRFDRTNKLNRRKTGGTRTMRAKVLVNLVVLVALLALSGVQPMNAPVVARELVVKENPETVKVDVLETFGQLPLSFIPNQGQVNKQVEYYVQSGGQSLWFTAEGITMALSEVTLHLEFLDASHAVQLEGVNKLAGIVNYFIGNDPAEWRTNIPTYGGLTYHNLWPGVDLTYEGRPGVLKSTFTIAPGVDPAQISLAYPDVDSLNVDQEGNLIINTGEMEMQERAPLAWQEVNGRRVSLAVSYQLAGRSYSFALPEGYDPAYPLVIDPSLIYSTFLGGSGQDYGYGIAVDGNGNAYVIGHTESSNFPTTSGGFDTSHNGDLDVFVVKLNATGTGLVYSTFLGGNSYERSYGIAVDGIGDAYVTGYTGSSDFPTTTGAFDTNHNGSADAFVVKLNATGTALLYATFLGGNNKDLGEDIVVDNAGNAYVTGETESSSFPTTLGAFDTSHNGSLDTFLVKLNTLGSALPYGTFLGGNSNDWSSAITVDEIGNAYVIGYTQSPNFPTTTGAFNTTFSGGDRDSFVVKLNATGTGLVYATFLGRGYNGAEGGIAVDGAGNAYVVGSTEVSSFPTTSGAFDTSYNGSDDAFVVKLNAAGAGLVYATFLGGSATEHGHAITIDTSGNASVAGYTYSSDFPTTSEAFDTTPNGYADTFLVKLNTLGSALPYATFLGGDSYDWGQAIALGENSVIYIAGLTYSSDFPTTAGAFDTSHNGGFRDVFVTKLYLGPGAIPSFLDLPVSYSSFSQSAMNKVNSWVDHTAPTYDTNCDITVWSGRRYTGCPETHVSTCNTGVSCYDGHNGVDFQHQWAVTEESVFAAASGVVAEVCRNNPCSRGASYGKYVLIDHGNNYATLYAHLNSVNVGIDVGTSITDPKSQPIGVMGGTGGFPVHLHFGVYYDANGNGVWEEPLESVDPYGWDELGAGFPDPWTPTSTYLWKYRLQEQKGVDSGGATITSPAGNKQATIPAGALSSLVTVELWDAPVASPSAQLRSIGQSFWLRILEWLSGGDLSASSGVTAMDFSLPVTLSVTYGLTETRHLNTTQLGIYQWNGSDWVALPTILEPGKVTAQSTDVGEFDVQAPLLCPADESEPDDHYDVASVLSTDGITVTRLFDISDDEDWIRFVAVAGKTYEVATNELTSGVSTNVELYDIDGVTLLASDTDGGAAQLEWQAPAGGTYFLRVIPAEGSTSGCSASYNLAISEKAQPGGIYLPIILKNHP